MKYGILFWVNCLTAKIYFDNKKIAGIMAGVKPRYSTEVYLSNQKSYLFPI
jgi:hypothetical protein